MIDQSCKDMCENEHTVTFFFHRIFVFIPFHAYQKTFSRLFCFYFTYGHAAIPSALYDGTMLFAKTLLFNRIKTGSIINAKS